MTDVPPQGLPHALPRLEAPPPPAEPGRSGRLPKVVLGIVLLVIAGLVLYFLIRAGQEPVAAEPGECIKVVSAQDAEIERVDCAAPEAVYKVAARLTSTSAACPEGEYSELTSGSSMKLCLMLNAKEGDCFSTTFAGRNRTHERVPCGPSAEYKVVKVVTGKADSKLCVNGDVVASYTEPPMTICLTAKP
jgi:hypothetical protein